MRAKKNSRASDLPSLSHCTMTEATRSGIVALPDDKLSGGKTPSRAVDVLGCARILPPSFDTGGRILLQLGGNNQVGLDVDASSRMMRRRFNNEKDHASFGITAEPASRSIHRRGHHAISTLRGCSGSHSMVYDTIQLSKPLHISGAALSPRTSSADSKP